MREAFDPAGLANPGKIFPTPRSCGESARRLAARLSIEVDNIQRQDGNEAEILTPLDVF